MQYQLNVRQQVIIPATAFTATGQVEKLDVALNAGLDAGLTLNEIKEILLQFYAYYGFPRSLNGLSCFMSAVKSRSEKGLSDDEGRMATPSPADRNSVRAGGLTQTQLVGQPVSGPLPDFVPAIDVWLKAYLFGDIFRRDVLDWQDRRRVIVSALAALGGVNSQLESHFVICLSIGIPPEQLSEFITILEQYRGAGTGENARTALDECLAWTPWILSILESL